MLYQHVEFCPYCGADHPLERTQRRRNGTQLRAVETQPPAPEEVHTAEPVGLPSLASPEPPISPLEEPPPLRQSAGRWIATKGIVLLLFIVALGYAGYLLLGDNHRQDTATEEATNSASTSGGSISPYTAPQSARNTPTANVTNVPAAKAPPAPIAPPRPRVAQHYQNVADALRAARTALARNNLAEAQSALSDALSVESGNTDAIQMQSDLKDRENKRDVALGAATTCAKDKQWGCVRERAAQALAIDVSSVDAQALLERMILTTGWKPLAGAAASAPRAGTPQANANANTNVAPAPAPAMPSNNTATTNTTATPPATNTASGIEAQMRAIRESGWKQAPSAKKQ
ncbi:zinc ribbon domain-containing protein [Paraburkholderia azotifigens]|uniref:zinc ribbon domain-containing protein n=1 Tax=Paraburkholderia azotifigens TaxID=2057004 RepID=UPI0038B8EF98